MGIETYVTYIETDLCGSGLCVNLKSQSATIVLQLMQCACTCIAGQLDLVSDFNELHSVILRLQALLSISNEVHPFHKPIQKKPLHIYTNSNTKAKRKKAN